MTVPLLDTHAWIWWIEGDRRLPRRVRDTLDQLAPNERPYLSAISLWEVAMLVERGRVVFSVSLPEWLGAAAHSRSVRIVPISMDIAAHTAILPATFHRDPADRLIVATSRVLGLPLLTRDARILRSRLVTRWSGRS
ncbi:MAG: type II toxin-antitoxin system VapC family toxin [Vicinamibacterales bacterium]